MCLRNIWLVPYPDNIPNISADNWNLNSYLPIRLKKKCQYVFSDFSLSVPKKMRKLKPWVDTKKKLKIILMVPDIWCIFDIKAHKNENRNDTKWRSKGSLFWEYYVFVSRLLSKKLKWTLIDQSKYQAARLTHKINST